MGGVVGLGSARSAQAAVAEPGVLFDDVYSPYLAAGTVLRRRVRNMPLASNSAAIAAYMPQMPRDFAGTRFPWLVTSLNTSSYTIPIYQVDSTVVGCPTVQFTIQPSSTLSAAIRPFVEGTIPFPSWAVAAGGGDYPLAIYDRGTGMVREYFQASQTAPGQWTATFAGYYQAPSGLADIAFTDPSLQLTAGSSSVVGMMSELGQIGISEALAGEITHALNFTITNSTTSPLYSWPARGGDGKDTTGNAPAEGQWFRIPPDLDLTTLNLRPFTLLIARAVQKYGGFASDKNLWCHAFNAEHPAVYQRKTGEVDPWGAGGKVRLKYGSLDPNDFPWQLTQWAPVGWGNRDCFSGIFTQSTAVKWVAETRYNDPQYTNPSDPTNTGYVHAVGPIQTAEYEGLFEIQHWKMAGENKISWRVPLASALAISNGRIDFTPDPANGPTSGPQVVEFDYPQRLANAGDPRVLQAFPGTFDLPATPAAITIPAGSHSRTSYVWVQTLNTPYDATKVYKATATFTGTLG